MRWLDWLADRLWPWSSIRYLRYTLDHERSLLASERRTHALAVAFHEDYRKQAEWWYNAVRGVLSSEQLTAVQARIDHEAEAECARIGNVLHANSPDLWLPSKGSGLMDPKLEGSPAGNAVKVIAGDKTLPKLDDLQRDLADNKIEIGGAVDPSGGPMPLRKEKDRYDV